MIHLARNCPAPAQTPPPHHVYAIRNTIVNHQFISDAWKRIVENAAPKSRMPSLHEPIKFSSLAEAIDYSRHHHSPWGARVAAMFFNGFSAALGAVVATGMNQLIENDNQLITWGVGTAAFLGMRFLFRTASGLDKDLRTYKAANKLLDTEQLCRKNPAAIESYLRKEASINTLRFSDFLSELDITVSRELNDTIKNAPKAVDAFNERVDNPKEGVTAVENLAYYSHLFRNAGYSLTITPAALRVWQLIKSAGDKVLAEEVAQNSPEANFFFKELSQWIADTFKFAIS